MKIITMYNNKGGVGKTTSVINIAYSLAKTGKNVLVMDLDEQKNSTRFFSGTDAVTDGNNCFPTRYERLSVMPYDECMKLFDYKCMKLFNADYAAWLRRQEAAFDYIIFDLPPALNDFTLLMLGFCDYVFVPIELGTFAIQGISVVADRLSKISAKFGGCFVVKFDNENPSDYSLLKALKDALGAKVMSSIIPFSRVIKNSVIYRMTAEEYMDYMAASEKYSELTAEIMRICEA